MTAIPPEPYVVALKENERLINLAAEHQRRATDQSLSLWERFTAYEDAAAIRSELGFGKP